MSKEVTENVHPVATPAEAMAWFGRHGFGEAEVSLGEYCETQGGSRPLEICVDTTWKRVDAWTEIKAGMTFRLIDHDGTISEEYHALGDGFLGVAGSGQVRIEEPLNPVTCAWALRSCAGGSIAMGGR